MNDLILLSTPVLAGLFLGQAAFLHQRLGWLIYPEAKGLATPSDSPQDGTSGEGAALWAQIEKDALNDNLALAKKALDAIPDVSCDAVAEAFGLPKLRVRRLSTRKRRKGASVSEIGVYTNQQIREAAGSLNECPF